MAKNEQDKAEIAEAVEILHLMRRVVESGRVLNLKHGKSTSIGVDAPKRVTVMVEIEIEVPPEDDDLRR